MSTKPSSRSRIFDDLQRISESLRFTAGHPVSTTFLGLEIRMIPEMDANDQPVYRGRVFAGSPMPPELKGLEWRLVTDRGRLVKDGQLKSQGNFLVRFPYDDVKKEVVYQLQIPADRFLLPKNMDETIIPCPVGNDRFNRGSRIGEYLILHRERNIVPLPPDVKARRWFCDATVPRVGKASTHEKPANSPQAGPLYVVGMNLWLTVPANEVPYGVVAVNAIKKGVAGPPQLMAMPRVKDDHSKRENFIELCELVDDAEDPDCQFDAYAILRNPETQRLINSSDLIRLHEETTDAEVKALLGQLISEHGE